MTITPRDRNSPAMKLKPISRTDAARLPVVSLDDFRKGRSG